MLLGATFNCDAYLISSKSKHTLSVMDFACCLSCDDAKYVEHLAKYLVTILAASVLPAPLSPMCNMGHNSGFRAAM